MKPRGTSLLEPIRTEGICHQFGSVLPPVPSFRQRSFPFTIIAPSEQLPGNRISTGIPRVFRTAAVLLTNVATLRGAAVDSSGFRPGILDSFA